MPKVIIPNYRIYNEDCFTTFERIKNSSVDFIFADLPYGITKNSWDSLIDFSRMWSEIERILKPNHAVCFTSSQPFTSLLLTSNIRLYNHCWVWDKLRVTGVLNAKIQPLRCHEDILVFTLGRPIKIYNPQGVQECYKPPVIYETQSPTSKNYNQQRVGREYVQTLTNLPRTILKFKYEHKEKVGHPTQKPVSLIEYLVKTYSHPGNLIVDFVMGSGTTGVACARSGRKFIGCESDISHGYFQIAQTRIKQAYAKSS